MQWIGTGPPSALSISQCPNLFSLVAAEGGSSLVLRTTLDFESDRRNYLCLFQLNNALETARTLAVLVVDDNDNVPFFTTSTSILQYPEVLAYIIQYRCQIVIRFLSL